MQYPATLHLPTNGTPQTLQNVRIGIQERYITVIDVFFPQGCVGLVYVQVVFQGQAISPAPGSPDAFFHGEGHYTTSFSKGLELKGATGGPPLGMGLDVNGFNLDDTYFHEPIITITGEDFIS